MLVEVHPIDGLIDGHGLAIQGIQACLLIMRWNLGSKGVQQIRGLPLRIRFAQCGSINIPIGLFSKGLIHDCRCSPWGKGHMVTLWHWKPYIDTWCNMIPITNWQTYWSAFGCPEMTTHGRQTNNIYAIIPRHIFQGTQPWQGENLHDHWGCLRCITYTNMTFWCLSMWVTF